MRRLLPALLGFPLLIFTIILYFNWSKNTFAAAANHIVISEIQTAGANGTDDEFVELYNPTDSDIDLTGWRLTRRTSSGTQNTLVSSVTGIIPAKGYFLVGHSASYSGSVTPDILYSAPSQNIASNNSVVVYSDAGISQVDLVGMGSATASETATIDNPPSSGSVERKANSASDATSMGTGGTDEFAGNGEDTDSNSADFVVRTTSQPQNSQSSIEPAIPSPTEEPSPSPTIEPSPSPTPTTEPSATPTLSPTPSAVPSVSPTLSPTPPTPTPKIIARGPIFTCTLEQKPWRFFGKTFFFPFIHCVRTI